MPCPGGSQIGLVPIGVVGPKQQADQQQDDEYLGYQLQEGIPEKEAGDDQEGYPAYENVFRYGDQRIAVP